MTFCCWSKFTKLPTTALFNERIFVYARIAHCLVHRPKVCQCTCGQISVVHTMYQAQMKNLDQISRFSRNWENV